MAFTRPPDYPERAKVLAARLAGFRAAGCGAKRNDRAKLLQQLLDDGADVMQLAPLVAHRHFDVLLAELAGTPRDLIADALGLTVRSVGEILRRREIVYMQRAIKRAQLERVIAGEFGPQAAARAASGAIMERAIKVGKGEIEDAKISDQLRAGETVLKVAGDLGGAPGGSSVASHLHALMRELSPTELRTLGQGGAWPERFKKQVETLKLGGPATR